MDKQGELDNAIDQMAAEEPPDVRLRREEGLHPFDEKAVDSGIAAHEAATEEFGRFVEAGQPPRK